MRVYHYLPSKWAITNLRYSRLKIATTEDMNDPFEFMCYDLPTREHRRDFKAAKDEMGSRFGVLCFSRSWKNPVLWSHYADRHRGVCLGFDVQDDMTIPVEYTQHRLELDDTISAGSFTEATADRWIRTKYEGWRYEDEVRVLPRLESRDPETGLYFAEFQKAIVLKEIIAGPLCSETQAIKAAIPTESTQSVMLVRLAHRSFDIVTDQRGWPD